MFDVNATTVTQNQLRNKPTHETTSGDGYKRSPEYRQWRLDVISNYRAAGMVKRAAGFASCADKPKRTLHAWHDVPLEAETVWVCSENQAHDVQVFCTTCDDRGCPDCAARQTARLVKRYIPVIMDAMDDRKRSYSLKHIVLTTPYGLVDENIETKFKRFMAAINKLFDHLLPDGWRDRQGLIAAAEFGTNGLKLHAHIIFWGQWLGKQKLSNGWKAVTGDECEVTFIKQIKGTEQEITNAVMETFKYSVKFWKSDAEGNVEFIEPELMPKLAKTLHRKRRIKSLGIFYGIGKPDDEPLRCEQCNAQMARIGLQLYTLMRSNIPLTKDREWLLAQPKAALEFILANKSPEEIPKADRPPPETVHMWPDWKPTRSHYDQ